MKINKTPINEKIWLKIWTQLVWVVGNQTSDKDLECLMVGLLSPSERVMMAKRLMIGLMTLKNWDSIKISTELKLSKATVYKYQRLLESDADYYNLISDISNRLSENEIELEDKSGGDSLIEKMLSGRNKQSKLRYS